MAAAVMQNVGLFKIFVYKPMGDVFMGSHWVEVKKSHL